jgi:hypothetical protein
MRTAALVLAYLLLAAPVAAQNVPAWRQQLEYQLRKDYDCEVNYLSNVEVKVINGDETVLARAHCTDNRAFDVSRPGTGKPFTIKQCSTLTC